MGIGTFVRRRREEQEEEEARGVVQEFVGLNQTDPEAARSMYPSVVNALITLKRTIPSAMLGGGTPGEAAKTGALGDVAAEFKFRTQGPSLATVGEPAQFPGTVGAPDINAPRPAGGQLSGLSTKDLLSFMGGKAFPAGQTPKAQFQQAALPGAIQELAKGTVSPQTLRVFDMNPPTFKETALFTIQQQQKADPKWVPPLLMLAAATGSDSQELAKLSVLEDYSKNRLPDQQLYDIAGLINTEVQQAYEYTKALLGQHMNPLQAKRQGLKMAALKGPQPGPPTAEPTPGAVRAGQESQVRMEEARTQSRLSQERLVLAQSEADRAASQFKEAQAVRVSAEHRQALEDYKQTAMLLGLYDAKTGGLLYKKELEGEKLDNPVVQSVVRVMQEQAMNSNIPTLLVPYIDGTGKDAVLRWMSQKQFGVARGHGFVGGTE